MKPPRLPLEEAAIEVEYAKLAPEAKQMFDWAHVLHRQVYDVLRRRARCRSNRRTRASRASSPTTRRRPDLAFSSVPKTMELMEGQYYSLAFRDRYPSSTGLIWAYHWLQVGLYEPLRHRAASMYARRAGVHAATRALLPDAGERARSTCRA